MANSSNSSYTNQLNNSASTNFGLENRARPKYLAIGSFQYTAFYGKISISKQFVMNLMTYGLLGGGVTNYGGDIYPVLSFGIGQKYYVSKKLAVRLDLRSIIFNGPNVTDPTAGTTAYKNANRELKGSEFSSILTLNNVIFGGLEIQL